MFGTAVACAVAMTSSLLPSASAEPCSVTVQLVGGHSLTFTVDVPAGTPVSALSLPIRLGVVSVSESCVAPSAPVAPVSSPPVVSSSAPAVAVAPVVAGRVVRQHLSARARSGAGAKRSGSSGSSGARSRATAGSRLVPASAGLSSSALRGSGGVPSPSNPTFAFALPGPAPLGVPNFFIDAFRIPPFLLPIYQAAGVEYDVPWQVLAGINEIETDYGRNLSISSAGALGWMQFLPATWKSWGVDANGDGVADPYNPVDAIFSAARYLHAAGASKNLGRAIFAYNHAGWYVQSVLLRAKLIGGMPSALVGALTGLVQGHFPVAAAAKYADDHVEALATRRVRGVNAALPIVSDPHATGVNVFAASGSPVIAVNDGKIVAVGRSAGLGRFVRLQDATGNTYTYAGLGSVPRSYPVPKPVTSTIVALPAVAALAAPTQAASAGAQVQASAPTAVARTAGTVGTARRSARAVRRAVQGLASSATALVKERLFAHPNRAASYAAGGAQQIASETQQIRSFQSYFSDALHLARDQYTLAPLRPGAIVVAGTILGRIGNVSQTLAPHVQFQIRPAGRDAPQIDPKPILDGWKLLEATAVYRANQTDPFGPGAHNPSIGQVLLMSKAQLQQRILTDAHVKLAGCLGRDIQAGVTDRRILAALEFLSTSGLDPTATALSCGAQSQVGSSVQIIALNAIPVLGHQGTGSITDMAIRRLLTLQGAIAPNMIVSLMSYHNQPNTLSLPDHAGRLQITYTPLYGQNKQLSAQIASALKPSQWITLIQRIGQIPEPTVPTTASKYAVTTFARG